MICAHCHVNRGREDRLPMGWTRDGTAILCPACWSDRYMMRSITIPVAAPTSCDWRELRPILDGAWAEARRLGNWALRQLALADEALRAPGEKSPGKMPRVYLYGLAGERYDRWDQWRGSKGAALCILRQAESRYRTSRYDVWRGIASLPSYRDDLPYPLDADQWATTIDDGGALLCTLALPGGRVTLRLKGGPGFRRQRAAVEQAIDGTAHKGEAAIYQRRRASGPSYLAVKLCLWLPRKIAATNGERTLAVRSDAESMWIAQPSWRDEPWRLHGDDIRARIVGHSRWRQRRADDLKHEKRWPEHVRAQMVADGESRLKRHAQRVDSWLHESTAALGGFAARNRVSCVVYDDTNHDWCETVPWSLLRERLKYKLHELGIEMELARVGVTEKTPELLAREKAAE